MAHSDTYKEIAQRIGSAAKHDRPGAKAKFGLRPGDRKQGEALIKEASALREKIAIKRIALDSADRTLVGAIEQMKNALATEDEVNFAEAMNLIRSADRVRGSFSRPGAKARFAQPPFSATDLNTLKRLVKQYEKLGKESAGELDRAHHHKALAIASTLHEIIDFAASGKTGRAYAQVRISTPEFQQLLPASLVKAAYDVTKSDTYARAGSKENMAQSLQDYRSLIGEYNALDKEISRLIDRAREMSAKSDRILSLFPKNERDPDAAAIAASRQAMAELRKELNVMLSRFQFSRPGAKARMSKEWQTIERYLEVLDTEFGEPRGKAAAQEMMRAAAAIGGDEGSRLKAAINTMATSRDYNARQRAYNAIASMMPFSRPGAKAKFGMTNAGYKALVDAIRQYGDSAPAAVVAQANQMKQEPTEFTDNEVMAVIAKMKQARASRPGAKAKMAESLQAMWDGKQWKVTTPSGAAWYSEDGKRWTKKHGEPVTPAEVRQYAIKLGTGFSRPGAKVANAVREGEKVSASDDAVSRKIRKLMDEGKPQKQAVAIALDLERRGTL